MIFIQPRWTALRWDAVGLLIAVIGLWVLGSVFLYSIGLLCTFIVIVGLVGATAWFGRERHIRLQRISREECPHCGQDLHGVNDKCPRCGHVVEEAIIRHRRDAEDIARLKASGAWATLKL
jgi:predicted RNA-binding Zn-ribbon protein involved in translation (DUF1610 family)